MDKNTPVLPKLVFLAALLLLAAPLFGTAQATAEMMSVKGDKVNLRSGPGIEHEIKCEYGSGFPVEVIKKQGDWLQVKDFEEETGWIHASHLHKKQQMIVKANKGQEQTINVRSGPGSENPIVAHAHYGVVVTRLEEKAGWVKVQHDSGLTGWINRSLLWGN